jgi:glycine/D-amino acid oxidase-like deaminating enzyme/nitrite reductase/ring-hydroxylating ferredoxin subunit
MVSDSGKTISPWISSVEMPATAALTENITVDVCVVGAGISGLTTAYLLAREGRKVAVLDDGPIGGGETGRTTAHIANALDDRYYELERLHGTRGIQLAAESHTAAINKVDEIVAAEEIDCDFLKLDGYLFEPKDGDPKDLERERDACLRAGLKVELVSRAPAPFDTGAALRFPQQAQFHPLKYLRGLAIAIQKLGGQIFTGTFVQEMVGGASSKVVTRMGKTVNAGAIVVATNTPVNDRVIIHSKQMPYRTYVIGAEVPRGSVEPILLWDDDMPYHYVRLMQGKDELGSGAELLIIGGEDHKTGQQEDMAAPFGRLELWARERYPMLGEVRFRWSGQVMEPYDAIAYIGRNPADEKNVYVITGDSGNGMTHGTIGGMLCTDLIMGRKNDWESLYDPRRKSLHPSASLEYTRENLNVVAQYRDYIARGDVQSTDEIKNGTGAIVRRGLKHVAAYRDAQGVLHERSAVCPHLHCIVRWNHVENSWDCPCHGSRFDPFGKVLNGPSLSDLNEA